MGTASLRGVKEMCAKGTPAPTKTSGELAINNFKFQLDQSTYSDDGECRRHLIVSIKAPTAAREEGRQPLDLALVIDTSGSMSGQPLAYAKRAAEGVVECLQAEDRLTLVTFGSNVHVLFSELSMDGSNKARALGAIGQFVVGGCTNLSGGWLAAGALLAESAGHTPEHHRQIILLSDGFANEGVVEPDLLASEARSLLDRGVPTSCVGVGDGYSTVPCDLCGLGSSEAWTLRRCTLHASVLPSCLECIVSHLPEWMPRLVPNIRDPTPDHRRSPRRSRP